MIPRLVCVIVISAGLIAGCSKPQDQAKQGGPDPGEAEQTEAREPITQEINTPPADTPPADALDAAVKHEPAAAAKAEPTPGNAAPAEIPEIEAAELDAEPGLYAIMETSMGNITILLLENDAPKTVANFVGLATGAKPYVDARTGDETKGNFYDGLTFHRVIPGFMIQGGCPLGTGTGGPGYKFEDEFSDNVQFDGPGNLAMANSGPNTNGSQFFITVAARPELNGRYTIFGKVVDGQDVADAISKVKRDAGNKPIEPVIIKRVKFQRVK
ncbi:MAG TPA: peptidylprolyl isomerase [Planctomycetota bacterium]|nr:peptidylprolyl isomerase [Planctomycetota bacterium]